VIRLVIRQFQRRICLAGEAAGSGKQLSAAE